MSFWVGFGGFWRPILAAFGSLLEPMLAFGDLTFTYLILPQKSYTGEPQESHERAAKGQGRGQGDPLGNTSNKDFMSDFASF